jgi:hypothetical protein
MERMGFGRDSMGKIWKDFWAILALSNPILSILALLI